MHALPPSQEQVHDDAEPPEKAKLSQWPLWHWGGGRGALLLLAAAGIAAFFLPWVMIERPDGLARSGFSLARGRAGWLWGGFAGWLVLFPLIATRRSRVALHGVRLIAAVLASMTFFEVMVLILLPPRGPRPLSVSITWELGAYLSAVLSLSATAVALRLGGKQPQSPERQPPPEQRPPHEALH